MFTLIRGWLADAFASTTDISLGMFLILTFGIGLWLVYGVLKGDAPLITANAVTLALAGGILVLKIKYLRTARPRN